MKPKAYQQPAQLFHLLSHPARLAILDELRRGEACVCHLQTALQRPQAYVSQQLRVLRDAGLVADRKDGLLVYYRIAEPMVRQLLNQTLGPAGEWVPLDSCPCPKCSPEGTCR